MRITSHLEHSMRIHVHDKSATNHIDYQKERERIERISHVARWHLPIYSLDLIASVEFFCSLSVGCSCPYRIVMPHSTDDLSNPIIRSSQDIHLPTSFSIPELSSKLLANIDICFNIIKTMNQIKCYKQIIKTLTVQKTIVGRTRRETERN